MREEPQKDGTEKFFYEIDKNSEIAKNLKGHLMLTTGDMNDNVSMVNTMRVADELIKANQRFQMPVFGGVRHSSSSWRAEPSWSKWLLGSSDSRADILELQKAGQATPSNRLKP